MKNGRRLVVIVRYFVGLVACLYCNLVFAACMDGNKGLFGTTCQSPTSTTYTYSFTGFTVKQDWTGSACQLRVLRISGTATNNTTGSVSSTALDPCYQERLGACPAGTVRAADGVQCIPSECPTGQKRDSVTGQCVKDCSKIAGQKMSLINSRGVIGLDQTTQANQPVQFEYQGCKYTANRSDGDIVCSGKNAQGQLTGCQIYFHPTAMATATGTEPDQLTVSLQDVPNTAKPTDRTDATKGVTDPSGNQVPTTDATSKDDFSKITNTSDTPASNCASKGMWVGDVNGKVVCTTPIGDQTVTSTNNKTTTTTNPDGTKTSTTETKTTTTNGDGTVTTKVTNNVTNNNGTTTTSGEEKTQDKKSFCEENPNLQLCKESSVNAGDCNAQFQCSGDAVNCEMVKQQWKYQCELKKDTKYTQAGTDATSGKTEKEVKDGLREGLGKTLDPSKFNQNAFLSGGCLQDKTFSAAGRTFTIPFSELCQYFDIIGNIMMALAFIGSLKIVFGKE